MQERALSIVMRSLQSVRDRATFEFTNRLSQLKSDDTDSAIWRHLKTRQKHMYIEEFYVPQMVKGPDDLGWGEVCPDLKVLEVPGKHLELFHEKYIHGILESTETFLEEFRS